MTTSTKTYMDKVKCPECKGSFVVARRVATAGKAVTTYCRHCKKQIKTLAGPIPTSA